MAPWPFQGDRSSSVPTWRCGRRACRLCCPGPQTGIRLPAVRKWAAGYVRPGVCLLGTEQVIENQALVGFPPLITLNYQAAQRPRARTLGGGG